MWGTNFEKYLGSFALVDRAALLSGSNFGSSNLVAAILDNSNLVVAAILSGANLVVAIQWR